MELAPLHGALAKVQAPFTHVSGVWPAQLFCPETHWALSPPEAASDASRVLSAASAEASSLGAAASGRDGVPGPLASAPIGMRGDDVSTPPSAP
jgi:hypothetical protein